MLGRHLGSPWSGGTLGHTQAWNVWIEATGRRHRPVIRISSAAPPTCAGLSDHGNVGGDAPLSCQQSGALFWRPGWDR